MMKKSSTDGSKGKNTINIKETGGWHYKEFENVMQFGWILVETVIFSAWNQKKPKIAKTNGVETQTKENKARSKKRNWQQWRRQRVGRRRLGP
jgi:hypothetical protein